MAHFAAPICNASCTGNGQSLTRPMCLKTHGNAVTEAERENTSFRRGPDIGGGRSTLGTLGSGNSSLYPSFQD